jgi:hypothetical protein
MFKYAFALLLCAGLITPALAQTDDPSVKVYHHFAPPSPDKLFKFLGSPFDFSELTSMIKTKDDNPPQNCEVPVDYGFMIPNSLGNEAFKTNYCPTPSGMAYQDDQGSWWHFPEIVMTPLPNSTPRSEREANAYLQGQEPSFMIIFTTSSNVGYSAECFSTEDGLLYYKLFNGGWYSLPLE